MFFKTKAPKYQLFIALLFLAFSNYIQSQNTTSNSIYDWFDSKVGKENLDINNGKILLNYDKSINGNDRFYFDNYYYGTIKYDNQIYNNILLNYDILNDEIVIKSNNESVKNAIVLIKEKVEYFILNNIKYVNLNYSELVTPEFIKGFLEERTIGTNFTILIKHKKDKSSIVKNDAFIDDFTERTYFYLKFKNQFYSINSKKDIVTILPEYKKNINEFYANNQLVEKSNKTKFLEDLFNYLNTIIK
ncbi:hypothetical protein OX283_000200 [Flavobacterium sp. SUN052]|uniref:hypothetical protein n=1 Tax=Flavobacterium sp. SUN052 TaxID=3002441 RepID=UPI00237DDA1C|nr:hypothetical protein [Flavobacterium sp. SUN052]MEC4003064.1 hypothetical protein [Flavobacterium sp. SUN052]